MAKDIRIALFAPLVVSAVGALLWSAGEAWPQAGNQGWTAVVAAGVGIAGVSLYSTVPYVALLVAFRRRIADGTVRKDLTVLLCVLPPTIGSAVGFLAGVVHGGPEFLEVTLLYGFVATFVGYTYAGVIAAVLLAWGGMRRVGRRWRSRKQVNATTARSVATQRRQS